MKTDSSFSKYSIRSIPPLLLCLFTAFPAGCKEPTEQPAEKPTEKTAKKPTEKQAHISAKEIAEADRIIDKRTGLTRVRIQGGEFQMGSNKGRPNEKPVRKVKVETFRIAQTEVTVAQFRKCVETKRCGTPSPVAPEHKDLLNWNLPGRDNHPVNNVNWSQAAAYCKWAAGRLPSEAEWEFAARSRGKPLDYPWGNKPADCEHAILFDGEESGCGKNTTAPVCSRPKGNTEQGLCDMGGNVSEWVQDQYHRNYHDAPADQTPWESARGVNRVYRGGAFYSPGYALRTSMRNVFDPSLYNVGIGFRCAWDPP